MKQSIKNFYSKNKLAVDIQKLLLAEDTASLCMKMYSKDNDVDVVIVDSLKYVAAERALVSAGWSKKNNKSKLRERDKDFFIHAQSPFSIHLHQRFSWNTVSYLNSLSVWQRKREQHNVFLPCFEDELLIIAAHSLFENMNIAAEERDYAIQLLNKPIDTSYIEQRARAFNWDKGLFTVLDHIRSGTTALNVSELLYVRLEKLKSDFLQGKFRLIANEIIAYAFVDWIWCYPKRFKNP